MVRARSIVNDCYILQEKLGEDAFCELWRASAMFSATGFLLRFLKPGLPDVAAESWRAMAIGAYGVRQAAIVDMVEIEGYQGHTFISSEYAGQTRLREIHEAGATFSLDHACRFILELAQGLDAFHQKNLVYGTLNAESVYVSRDAGVITELRFLKPGYAPLVPYLRKDDIGSILENQGYLSPELKGISGHSVDGRSDIYALGVHLYRFITGLMPFRGQSASRALDKSVSVLHVAKALARREVPPELIRIAVSCLRRNPRQRYPDVVELVRDLKDFMDGRRKDSLRAGDLDPLAGLDSLNKSKERVAAAFVVRSLDMAEYFRVVSEGYLEAMTSADRSGKASRGAAPGFRMPDGLAELEELECVETEDDESLSSDDYVDLSLGPARGGIRKSERPGPVAASFDAPRPDFGTSSTPERHETGDRPATRENPAAAISASGPPPGLQAAPAAYPGATAASTRQKNRQAGPRSANQEAGGELSWRYKLIREESMAGAILASFKDAQKKRGSLRFLEPPRSVRALAATERVFELMVGQGVLLRIRPASRGAPGFLAALRAGLTEALAARNPRERRRFAEKSAAAADMAEATLSHEAGAEASSRRLDEAARALLDLGGNKRALSIIWYDTDELDPSCLEYLIAVARNIAGRNACSLAFFEGEPPVSYRTNP